MPSFKPFQPCKRLAQTAVLSLETSMLKKNYILKCLRIAICHRKLEDWYFTEIILYQAMVKDRLSWKLLKLS
jgi:hypothetical protein